MDNKKVLLINPAYENREIVYFPLGLGYIAGSCDKHGIEVKCIDVNATSVSNHQILEMIENEGFHIVGIGGFLTQVHAVIELTNLIKSRAKDVIIIIGGIQVFGCERFIMENSKADIICVGESEMLFPELIKALYEGKDISKIPAIIYRNKDKVIKNEGFPLVPDLDEINLPKYDAFNIEKYITQNYHGFPGKRTIDFICSRGCPYSCTYCINSLKPVKMRYRSPDNIVREIRLLKEKYKIDDFSFCDENFTVNREKALEICEAVKGENISWVTSVRADGVDNDILAAMKKAGMRRLIIGFESGSEKILKSVNKKVSISRYNDTVKLLKRHDILFCSNFIIGMPEEDEQTIKETEAFCINNNLIFGPSYATPFPGTKLYEEMRDRIKDEKKYIYSLAKMNFSKRPIINLTKMSMRKLVYLRNRTVVNSTVNLIRFRVRSIPVFIIKSVCWCYILVFNMKNALIAKIIHSITQKIYKFLAKSHG